MQKNKNHFGVPSDHCAVAKPAEVGKTIEAEDMELKKTDKRNKAKDVEVHSVLRSPNQSI